MADVFEVLSKDHVEVKQMLTALERPPGTDQESRHEAVEEEYFWQLTGRDQD